MYRPYLHMLLWFEVLYFGFGFAFAIEIGRMVRSAMGPLRKQLYVIWGGMLLPVPNSFAHLTGLIHRSAGMTFFALTWFIHSTSSHNCFKCSLIQIYACSQAAHSILRVHCKAPPRIR
jgi:hypothetical protein